MNNVLGAISFVLTTIALYLMGIPAKVCFIVFSFSLLFQMVVFYRTKQWFLLLQMVVLLIFQIITYFKWLEKGIG